MGIDDWHEVSRKKHGYRSYEDDVAKISISIYVSNLPETFSAKDLFHACNKYGHVVDSFIPLKRSKEGKRFGFVKFINVSNVERLVGNLCTVWVGRYKLQANKARFGRPPLNGRNIRNSKSDDRHLGGFKEPNVRPTNGNKETRNNSFASVLKSNQPNNLSSSNMIHDSSPAIALDDDCLSANDLSCVAIGKIKDINALSNLSVILNDEGCDDLKRSLFLVGLGLDPIKLRSLCVSCWNNKALSKIVSPWGTLTPVDLVEDSSLPYRKVCVTTKEPPQDKDIRKILWYLQTFLRSQDNKDGGGIAKSLVGVNDLCLKMEDQFLDVIEKLGGSRQTMGYNMAGCKKKLRGIFVPLMEIPWSLNECYVFKHSRSWPTAKKQGIEIGMTFRGRNWFIDLIVVDVAKISILEFTCLIFPETFSVQGSVSCLSYVGPVVDSFHSTNADQRKRFFHRLYAWELKNGITVADKLIDASFVASFRRNPRGGVEEEQLHHLVELVGSISLSPSNDRWAWLLGSSGEFSVHSARTFIDDILLPFVGDFTRWVKVVPIKVNILAWKVCLDKLPTRLNLSLRGIDIPSIICPNCGLAGESCSHLFYSCNLARTLWRKIARWWEIDIPFFLFEDGCLGSKLLGFLKIKKEMLEWVFYCYVVGDLEIPHQVLLQTIRSDHDWDRFEALWKLLQDSPTWISYTENYERLQTFLSPYPRVLRYIHDNWLDKYKNHFVSASIDQSLNFGNRTTNKVESQHAKMKEYIHEDHWPRIRSDLVRELDSHRHQYMSIFGTKCYNQIYRSVRLAGERMENARHRIGKLLASRNKVVVSLSNDGGCATSFPLWSDPPQSDTNEIIVIAPMNGRIIY
ncbi:RNA-directed DNA polymerase, eukaryota [Tanacetum coccineum]|uniref:RNA-directed DNA polymerase, eukaryota n=1 Tax=Tanacetum coccineum TaxID=301880 RepID=A0ABQ5H8W5_9ASTR